MSPTSRAWRRHLVGPGTWLYQPDRGYRVAMDPFLLAGWVIGRGVPRTAIDAGSGSGILALMLARAGAQVVGVDVNPEWMQWSTRSAEESGLSERARFVTSDLRLWHGPQVDLVVSNPPYFSPGTGAAPADTMRAQARHALCGDLQELIPRMTQLAPRVALVLPIHKEAEARRILESCGHPVTATLQLHPRLVLLEGSSVGGVVHAESAPLRANGCHHPKVRQLYHSAGAFLSGSSTIPQTL